MSVDLTKAIRVERDANGCKIYIVPCSRECGRMVRVRSDYAPVATGKCRHCAQIIRDPLKSTFYELQKAALRRGIPIDLTLSEFESLTEGSSCTYCGKQLNWSRRNYNLDRKNSSLGYTVENVVVCCKECNRVKGSIYSYEQMLKLGVVLRTFTTIELKQRTQMERRRDKQLKWIHKNGKGKQVGPNDLQEYLSLGWSLGRSKSHVY